MPYPLNSGGRIAIFETIKSLSKNYKLTLIIIDDNKKNIIYVEELEKYANKVYFFSKSKIYFYVNSLIGFFKGYPLQVGYFYFSHIQRIVNEEAKTHDIVYSFMIRTSLYGITLNNYKILNSIDSIYLSYRNSYENTSSLFWKFIYYIESNRLFKIERNHVENYKITTFVNFEECFFWSKYGNCLTLSHGLDDQIFSKNKIDGKFKNVVTFIGRMDYQPNIDAVKWFLLNVMPFLNDNIDFYIIGGHANFFLIDFVKKFSKVYMLGFVDDPNLIISSNLCNVAPMQTGGGLQTKILLSMGLGSIVVTTSYSVAAIEGAEDKVNLLLVDDPVKMAKLINDIYDNESKYAPVKERARSLILDKYVVSVIEDKLFKLIDNIGK